MNVESVIDVLPQKQILKIIKVVFQRHSSPLHNDLVNLFIIINYLTKHVPHLQIVTFTWSGTNALMSLKTSTCVLFKPDKTFHSFGYEAEDHYGELVSDKTGEHKEWYYFRRFKMQLFDTKVCIVEKSTKFIRAMYGVNISQLITCIRFASVCNHVSEFNVRNKCLS